MTPDDQYALARFLKHHREAKGLNHREVARALPAAGGKATPQAVQQWENTNIHATTTRPSPKNRNALATVLDCDRDELEKEYHVARAAAKEFTPRRIYEREYEVRLKPAVASAFPRRAITEQVIHHVKSLVAQSIEGGDQYVEGSVQLFGVKKNYDYLSPQLAVEWAVVIPDQGRLRQPAVESMLYRLLWLAAADKGLGVHRRYLLILVNMLPAVRSELRDEEHRAMSLRLHDYFESLQREVSLVSDRLAVRIVTSTEEAAALVEEFENQ